MNKIKILIAHSSSEVKTELRKCIQGLDYIEIVDEVTTGKEVLDRILKYEPDIVFTKYDMKDIDMVEVIQMTERVLQEKAPIVKFISNDLKNKLHVNYELIQKKFYEINAHIKEIGKQEVIKVIEDYYKNI